MTGEIALPYTNFCYTRIDMEQDQEPSNFSRYLRYFALLVIIALVLVLECYYEISSYTIDAVG